MGTSPDEATGVRISLPLNRIQTHINFGIWADFPTFTSLHVHFLYHQEMSNGGNPTELQTIQLGALWPSYIRERLENDIADMKERTGGTIPENFPIIMDFGPLITHKVENLQWEGDVKQVRIREALSLDSRIESDLWSKFTRIVIGHPSWSLNFSSSNQCSNLSQNHFVWSTYRLSTFYLLLERAFFDS